MLVIFIIVGISKEAFPPFSIADLPACRTEGTEALREFRVAPGGQNTSCQKDLPLAQASCLSNFPETAESQNLCSRKSWQRRVPVPSLCQGFFAFFVHVPWTSWKSGEPCGPLLKGMFFRCLKYNTWVFKENY